jgi:hypothetical protein
VETYQETDFRAVLAALEVAACPDTGVTPDIDIISRPSSLLTVRGQNRFLVAAARLLHRIASLLVTPVVDGPSPCCRNEFLVPYTPVPGMLFCSRDGRLYPERGAS